ncbi:MAG TPA: hypothetical protein VH853_18870 [Polyangia bacterium]|jgi:hypothetical protein|nr:hypothetical protein [Polyangia bacterium]
MRLPSIAAIALLSLSSALGLSAACGGDRLDTDTQAESLTCQAPPGVSAQPDAGAAGCFRTAFQICDSMSCKDACGASDYSLSCSGASAFGSIPQPDATLGCTVLPIPTPSDVLIYCCPCVAPPQ